MSPSCPHCRRKLMEKVWSFSLSSSLFWCQHCGTLAMFRVEESTGEPKAAQEVKVPTIRLLHTTQAKERVS